MIIGIPKEIKPYEYRVSLVPEGIKLLCDHGATVLVEKGAGEGCGISDLDYQACGAEIIGSAKEVWSKANMIVKVKEPLESEYELMQRGQILYTYLHLAVVPKLAQVLKEKKISSIAYETIEDKSGQLPLLKPMSEVAGKMSVQIGASYLQCDHGGRGVLLGGIPGVPRGKVTILGAGTVGTNACKIAVGLGADVRVIDINVDRLEYIDDIFGSQVTTLKSNPHNIFDAVTSSDLVVGAVLIAGAKAPTLVNREMISQMPKGSVIVDVAVDQGGCVETCKPTTHDEPIFLVDGVIHYCVANMPGAVARSSTYGLTNSTLGYALQMVADGVEKLAKKDKSFAAGLNTYAGHITHPAVAESLGEPFRSLEELIL